jgi:hypothetical protein
MIKKLRLKFIVIAMLSVIIVLAGIMATINITNYSKTKSEWEEVLSVLCENDGKFPVEGAGQGGQNNPTPHKGGMNGMENMSPETPYATRFFSVKLSEGEDGQLYAYADVERIAAVSAQEAANYAAELYNKGKTKGMYGNYRYRAVEKEGTGETLYVFLDCTNGISSLKNFLSMSILFSLLGVALVFVLVFIFSRVVFKPVEESYIKQKQFITDAGHDIKTPLTIIGADAEVIELEQGENEWTKDIKKQIGRLTSLTEKLVFLSKMEEGTKIEFCPFDLSEMLEETVVPYEAAAKVRGLTIKSEIEQGLIYNGNEELLSQAVALLMDNATKYAAEGDIIVSLKKQGKNYRITFKNAIADGGAADCEKWFERFYRADSSRNSKTGGNGIGLSAARAIITAHKGKLTALPSPDHNSVEFVIVL